MTVETGWTCNNDPALNPCFPETHYKEQGAVINRQQQERSFKSLKASNRAVLKQKIITDRHGMKQICLIYSSAPPLTHDPAALDFFF